MKIAQTPEAAHGYLHDLFTRAESHGGEILSVSPYTPEYLALAREVIEAAKVYCAPLTITVHVPKSARAGLEESARGAGLSLEEFCNFLLTAPVDGLLDEGVANTANDILADYEDSQGKLLPGAALPATA